MSFFDWLKEDDPPDKYFIWARKIEEQVLFLEEGSADEDEIREYLQKCADMREEHLDAFDLTETEAYYTGRVHKYFLDYSVLDPIWEQAFGR